MNKTQKGACYGILLSVLFVMIAVIDTHETSLGPITERACYAIVFGLMILPPFLLRKKRGQTEMDFDERDKLIIKRGLLAGFVLVSALLIAAYLITLFAFDPKRSIQVSQLPDIVYGIFLAFILSSSIAILIQYGRGGKNGGE